MVNWIKAHRWFLGAALALLILLLLVRARSGGHQVATTEAFSGPLSLRIAASGLVENDAADLAFQASGRVVELYVREGEAVDATQILARLSAVGGLSSSLGAADVIQAPYDGTVVSIYLREGSVVAPGQPVLRLVSAGRPWITAFIDSEDAAHLRPGQTLQCRAGGYLSEPREIVVHAVGEEALPRPDLPGSARQVRVRCDIPGPPLALAPGTEVDIDGEVPLLDNGLLIPAAAVVHEDTVDWVWVVESGRAYRREVELGPNNFDLIHLRSGLQPGEQVVVHGKQGLTDGLRVKAEASPPPAAP